jgi:hypothetical protein
LKPNSTFKGTIDLTTFRRRVFLFELASLFLCSAIRTLDIVFTLEAFVQTNIIKQTQFNRRSGNRRKPGTGICPDIIRQTHNEMMQTLVAAWRIKGRTHLRVHPVQEVRRIWVVL